MSSQSSDYPTKLKDLTGRRFGMLVVLSIVPERDKSGKVLWLCRCDCGEVKPKYAQNLTRGETTHCGCQLHALFMRPNTKNKKHGLYGTWVYTVWSHMIHRCYKKSHKSYKYYGGRGITVCQRWLDSPQTFYEDMGDRPSPKHSIERKNNNGHYEPSNCVWATNKEQSRNRRGNHVIEFMGQSRLLVEWAEIADMKIDMLCRRLKQGWTMERALSLRFDRNRNRKPEGVD